MVQTVRYTREQMSQAINAVQNGVSVGMASRLHSVPDSTLQVKLKLKTQEWRKLSQHMYLTQKEENDIVDWINLQCKRGLPPHREDVLTSAQNMIVKVQRENPFKDSRPVGNWFEAFIKRNPNVTVRTEDESEVQVTRETIREWFINLKAEMKTIGALDIFEEPSRVFSVNEKNIEVCPTTGRAVGVKEWKNTFEVGAAPEILAFTLLGTFNAKGDIVSPGLIYPYSKIPCKMSNSLPDNWFCSQSDNGLLKTENFYEYLENGFIPWLKAYNIKKPVILFIDGCKMYTSSHIFELCEENGVILYLFPPNTAHILQPNVVGPLKHFKDYWIAAVGEFQNGSQNVEIECRYTFPLLYNILHSKVTKSSIVNGFLETGLCPFDENKPHHSKYITTKSESPLKDASVTKYENISEHDKETALNVVKVILGREVIEELQTHPSEVDPVLRNLWITLNNSQYSVTLVEENGKRLYLNVHDAVFLNDEKLQSAKVVCTRLEDVHSDKIVEVLKGDSPTEEGVKKGMMNTQHTQLKKNCSVEGKDPWMALEDGNKVLSHKVHAEGKQEASEEYSPPEDRNWENCSRVSVKREIPFIKEEPDIPEELLSENSTEMFAGFEPYEQLCSSLDSTSHLHQSVEEVLIEDTDCFPEANLEGFSDSDLPLDENIYQTTTFRSPYSNSMHSNIQHDDEDANCGAGSPVVIPFESVYCNELSGMDLNGARELFTNIEKKKFSEKRFKRKDGNKQSRHNILERRRRHGIRARLQYLHCVAENRPLMEMKFPSTVSILRNAEELIIELEKKNEKLMEMVLSLHKRRKELMNKISHIYKISEEELENFSSWIPNPWADPKEIKREKEK